MKADQRPGYAIAAAASLTYPQLHRYMNGDDIPLVHLRRLCATLMCDPEDILEKADVG